MKLSQTAFLLLSGSALVFAQPQQPKSLLRSKKAMHDIHEAMDPAPLEDLGDQTDFGRYQDKKAEEEFPTFAEEVKRVEETTGSFGPNVEVQVLHDLLLKAANAKHELDQALKITGVDHHEMESIFTDHDDLAEDVLEAFDDLEYENEQMGQEIVRFLQDHLVEEADGSYRYVSSTPDPVEEYKKRRRHLDEKRNDRWQQYHQERALLPQKLREHRSLLRRHLSDDRREGITLHGLA